MLDKFEREVDPNNELTLAERAKRAESARKAYFTRLSLKSAQVRRSRSKDSRAQADQVQPATTSAALSPDAAAGGAQ